MNEAKLEVQFMSFLPEATGSSRQARSAWSKLLQGVLAPVGLPQWPLRRQPHPLRRHPSDRNLERTTTAELSNIPDIQHRTPYSLISHHSSARPLRPNPRYKAPSKWPNQQPTAGSSKSTAP
jgi:hypothetical protein